MSSIIDQALIIAYILAMFVIGILMYRRARNYDEYLIAGRRFSPWFVALILAAGISSATMGVAALGFETGMAGAWFFISLGIGAWLLMFTVAGRLRRLASYSLTDVFAMRYGPASRVVVGLLGTVAYTVLLSIGFVGGGVVFQSVFPVGRITAMVIIAVPFIAYTALGGLWASALTNIVKFFLLAVVVIILVPVGIHSAGGWNNLTASVPAGSFNLFSGSALLMAFGFFWVLTLSMWVAADIYQLVFSTKSIGAAKFGLGVAGVLIIVLGLVAAFIGMSASVGFPDSAPDAAMATLGSTLGPGLRGLVAVGLLAGSAIAVVMYQLVAATLFVRGVLPRAKSSMGRIRWLSAAIGAAGVAVAVGLPDIVSLTLLTFRIMIPATFVPTLAAFYWKRASGRGAVASAVSGAVSSGLWTWLALPRLSPVLQEVFEPALVGVVVSLVSLVAVSYLLPSPYPAAWDKASGRVETEGIRGANAP